MRGAAIGIDVGGHGVKGVVVDVAGRVLARGLVPLRPEDRSVDGVEARVAALVHELSAGEVADLPVGVGVPGFFDREAGLLRSSPNFPEWQDTPVAARMSARLSRPVMVENDANCAVLGEAFAGAAQGARDVVMLTLGTGVGTGFLVGGRLLRGVRGAGAEGGHLCIRPAGRRCGCGRSGCLETYCSGPGLILTAREEHDRVPQGPAPEDAAAVFLAASEGAPWALRARARFIDELADGLVAFVHVFSPAALILGGGVAQSFAAFAPDLEAAVTLRAIPACLAGVLPLRPALLGADAGAVGAACLALGGGD